MTTRVTGSSQNAPEFSEGIALVAGGSGGLGEGVCLGLAELGSNVALTYFSNKGKADKVAEKIRHKGTEAVTVAVNLEDADAVKTMVDDLVKRFGRIHSVVYAAGPPLEFLYIHDISPAHWAKVVCADINGCFNLVSAVLPHLRAQGGGSIVSLITAAVSHPPPRDIMSAAPKAAIEALMRGLAREEGRFGIRANCVGPGFIDAGMGMTTVNETTQPYVDKMTKATPLKRRGTAEEVADAVCFLLSEKSRYVTGETIAVAGGLQIT